MVNHVTESLSGWERRSPTSSSPSSRASPAPEDWKEEEEENELNVEESATSQDSGLASAETSAVVEIKENFNLGEIINFVSSSWNKVSHDAPRIPEPEVVG